MARTTHPNRTEIPDVGAGRGLPRALRAFLETEASGGIVLLVAAAVALVWANSPWSATYTSLWHTEVRIGIGTIGFDGDLQHLVNDALMAIFFFVVGLEIKRELVAGELQSWRTASLPAFAALGGMVVPALIYTAVNTGASAEASRGWGIPMATDIAFAIGVVALLGRRVPSSLKLFLLTLAIVDDLGAIVVIAIFYSSGLDVTALGVAAGAVAATVVVRKAGVTWIPAYVALGVVFWLATYESGVHATIAGAIMGLLAPARPLAPSAVAREWAADLSDEPTPAELRAMTMLANRSVSVAERLEALLHPVTSFAIIPIFALANAGVRIQGDSLDAPGAGRVVLGVVLGLVVGKTVGVTLFAWLAVRLGVSHLPRDATWQQVVGIAAAAGIGFTVSLFIAGLAFDSPDLENAAKIGIVAASVVATGLGALILRSAARSAPAPAAE
jgi:NhaA family Na+:H+ antiporter